MNAARIELETIAADLTEVVARLDDDPFDAAAAEPDVLLSWRAADLLRDVHRRLHAFRRRHAAGVFVPASVEGVVADHVANVLAYTGNRYGRAAQILDINKSTLYRIRKRKERE